MGYTVRVTGVVVAILAVSIGLSGCAGDSSDGSLSLLDTKLAVQLLRNTVSGQVSSASTEDVSQVDDASEACEDDADGFMRMWRSTALTELTAERSGNVKAMVQTIAGGLTAKGWTSDAEQKNDSKYTVELENPNAIGVIRITSTEDVEGDDLGGTIFVEVTGPCVKTDGPGSDELTQVGE